MAPLVPPITGPTRSRIRAIPRTRSPLAHIRENWGTSNPPATPMNVPPTMLRARQQSSTVNANPKINDMVEMRG